MIKNSFDEIIVSGSYLKIAHLISRLSVDGVGVFVHLNELMGKFSLEFSDDEFYPWAISEALGSFKSLLEDDRLSEGDFPKVLSIIFPFIREKAVRTGRQELLFLGKLIVDYAKGNIEQVRYLNTILYIDENIERIIITELIRRPVFKKLEALHDSVEEADARIQRIVSLKENIEESVANANSSMATWKKDWGFVELSKGFKKIHDDKLGESKFTLASLLFFGFSLLALPAFQIIFGRPHVAEISSLLNLIPFVTAEIIAIYFFRIALQNRRSVKAQLLQIELRITLIQFVQQYAEFSRDKKFDGLKNFESLIFSSIVPDEKAIPSVFDGADQIAKIIREIRPKNG